ncbi:MAG: creatininase family protein [bacterium]
MERRLQNLNWKTVKSLLKTHRGAILPVGTMEAHGCANLGTDITIPEFIAEKVAEKLNLLIAPTVNYGITRTLLPYSGSLTVSPEVFEAYVLDVAESLIKTGFEWILILNGHGGNNAELESVARRLWKNTGGKSIVIHWWDFCEPVTVKMLKEKGTHAGLNENYMVMAANPDLVREDLFDEEDVYFVRDGAYPYPNSGTILKYENNPAKLRFDRKEAEEYASAVVDYIYRYVKKVVQTWERTF